MTIRVALRHETCYRYSRPVSLGPQIARLRPAAHCRTPVLSYSFDVWPKEHFINWQQDPYGNFLARLVFAEKTSEFRVDVGLVADMTVVNPFDFFLEPEADQYPFQYEAQLRHELTPYLQQEPEGPLLSQWLEGVDRRPRRTIDFLVDVNRRLQQHVEYLIRMEPGVQACEETLAKRSGSCRDTSWLLVQLLRRLGFASRFVSGYLIQLKADQPPLDGPAGAAEDFTDLHAWTEVYLPGAGWIGLDPTSGLLAGEGHLPLACTPNPQTAAPITGMVEPCEGDFGFSMSVRRVHEDPRVTKPYTDQQWQDIDRLGRHVDERLSAADVRLTMGGEPTFVSIDDMEGAEWRTEALGPHKRQLAYAALLGLQRRFGPQGFLYFGEGKWYPGEPLPRWTMRCYWRRDGQPLWRNHDLLAEDGRDYGHDADDARRLCADIAARLAVDPDHVSLAYEDAMYYAWRERRMPVDRNPLDGKLDDPQERVRFARIFEQGLTAPVGALLPLQRLWWLPMPVWRSGPWVVRSDELLLTPGDSPMGLRLPLASLVRTPSDEYAELGFPQDPFTMHSPLADYDAASRAATQHHPVAINMQSRSWRDEAAESNGSSGTATDSCAAESRAAGSRAAGSHVAASDARPSSTATTSASVHFGPASPEQVGANGETTTIRTALCVEPRGGGLHVFFPPLDRLEDYLELLTVVEDAAEALQAPVVIEGYPPPHDPRIQHFSVTPDPGVVEINVHPARDWEELKEITDGAYEEARLARLGVEKFDRDGLHAGTGGGNHVVLGGPTTADSPFLRRPDLLRSLVAYWHNHPSLSYLFSGRFVGPTSQAPRADEGRRDSRYEMEIAFQQIPEQATCPPWLVDRLFRHLLVDTTGNTHRSEFCIDKLFSPDSANGRLGLVEFRAFEMPPHVRMSLTQQLLMRAFVARFWERPYRESLVDWGTSLHDRFLLPYFLWRDFKDVLEETRAAGFSVDDRWFAPHFEFRFPKIGELAHGGVQLELRQAIEPWYVLGEEAGAGGTTRFVDSSVERLQVHVRAMTHPRHVVTCNGRRVPLHATGVEGEYVAGVRYRAWQPPSCLHPTIPADEPLVFDVVDSWMRISIGGCRYHVGHPGGNNPESFPVNAYEAESRRAARFFRMGHAAKSMEAPGEAINRDFPLTLDLRRDR